MIFFIRNEKNRTIFEAEYWIETREDGSKYLEISCDIDVKNYSKFLLDNQNNSKEIIDEFSFLSELRGWLWEIYFSTRNNTEKYYDNVLLDLRKIISETAKKFNLIYTED